MSPEDGFKGAAYTYIGPEDIGVQVDGTYADLASQLVAAVRELPTEVEVAALGIYLQKRVNAYSARSTVDEGHEIDDMLSSVTTDVQEGTLLTRLAGELAIARLLPSTEEGHQGNGIFAKIRERRQSQKLDRAKDNEAKAIANQRRAELLELQSVAKADHEIKITDFKPEDIVTISTGTGYYSISGGVVNECKLHGKVLETKRVRLAYNIEFDGVDIEVYDESRVAGFEYEHPTRRRGQIITLVGSTDRSKTFLGKMGYPSLVRTEGALIVYRSGVLEPFIGWVLQSEKAPVSRSSTNYIQMRLLRLRINGVPVIDAKPK